MDAMTRVVWDFMEGAHRKGLLDEMLALTGGLAGPGADLGELMAGFEDTLMGSDLAGFEAAFGPVLVPVLRALSDERVQEDLLVVVRTARFLLEAAAQRAGGDIAAVTGAAGEAAGTLRALRGVAAAVLPVVARVYGPSLRAWLRASGGRAAGRLVNTLARAVVEDPDTVRSVVSGLLVTVDGPVVRGAAGILAGSILERKPPFVAWTASVLVGRARKRVFGRWRRGDGNR